MNITFARVPGWKRHDLCRPGWHHLALPAVFFASEASHLTAVIPGLRVTKAMIGAKVIIFVVCHACLLCFSNFVPELVPRVFGLLSTRKLGWNFSYEPKAKLAPVTGPVLSTGLMWRSPNYKICNSQRPKVSHFPGTGWNWNHCHTCIRVSNCMMKTMRFFFIIIFVPVFITLWTLLTEKYFVCKM